MPGQIYASEEISSGLITRLKLEDPVPSLEVEHIRFDSAFRTTQLQPGDRIVAVNGVRVTGPGTPLPPGRSVSHHVGQYGESYPWSQEGAKEGTPLRLTLRRRSFPKGWHELEVEAPLRAKRSYSDDSGNRPWLGPEGPESRASDGLGESWAGWHEQYLRRLARAELADPANSFDDRAELRNLEADRDRIRLCVERYPGAFSQALAEDFARVERLLSGAEVQLPPGALDYRVEEQVRKDAVAQASLKAWEERLAAALPEQVPPFPAPNPVRADFSGLVDKLVLLPTLRNRDWVMEADHAYMVAGNAYDGWYFVDAETQPIRRMLRAARRYERVVSPYVPEEYTLLGRILPEPRLLVIQGQGHFGLQVRPLAALAGRQLYIALDADGGDDVPFAGEEAYNKPILSLPPNDAPPEATLQAMISAIQDADQATWQALFAPWRLSATAGQPCLHPFGGFFTPSDWERSREAFHAQLMDARVLWTSEPEEVMHGTEYPGAPKVEQVEALLQHIGSFDGVFKSYVTRGLHRAWILQRVNGGPWRIATPQSI